MASINKKDESKTITWGKYFDKIFCLSLADNVKRREELIKEFSRVGIDVNADYFEWKITVKNDLYKYIWTNKNLKTETWFSKQAGAFNCTIGHYEILKESQVLGYENILIIEDDIKFLKNIQEIKKMLDNQVEYDICLFDKWPAEQKDREAYSALINKCKVGDLYVNYEGCRTLSCGLYALTKKAIDRIIELQESKFMPADWYTNDTELVKVCAIKNLAIQDASLKEFDKSNYMHISVYNHLYDGIVNKSDYNVDENWINKYTENTKYSVLTYIFGDYEIVREIEEKDSNAEYILVTDNKDLKSDTWKVVYDETLDGLSVWNKVFSVRYNLFKYCTTDICFRIDGSIKVKKSLSPIIRDFVVGGYDACLMLHPYRNNILDEYNVWIAGRNYSLEQAKKCAMFMQKSGYDFNYKGLFELGISISRRNKISSDIDSIMLSMLKVLGNEGEIERLDQTVFTFVMNKWFNNMNIMPVSQKILQTSFLQMYNHGTEDEISVIENSMIEPYMFNNKVEINDYK